MSSILDPSYFKVKKNGITPFETMVAYLGGSAFQTVVDNPVTAYRQLVQQYAKDLKGNTVDPKVARLEANAVFKANPISASLSGLGLDLLVSALSVSQSSDRCWQYRTSLAKAEKSEWLLLLELPYCRPHLSTQFE